MKKQFIQKLSIAMAAALTVTSVAQVPVSAAAKDMKMDKTSKILYLNEDNSSKTGKVYDFSIKNKPKDYKKLYTFNWYADDEAIVTVKKGGVVTAKKVGKTTVNCDIKNKKGKTVALATAKVEVKANAATVDINNAIETMAPGESYDFNRTMKNFKGGKATDKTQWIVSANEEGTEATDVATVDSKGIVTTAKAGEFYLTARCYQSSKYKERTTASKTIKITVKASITEATNSAYNTFKLTFNDDMSAKLTEKNITITNATGINQVISGVSFEENGKVAKVKVYNDLANDAVYTVKAGDLDPVEVTAKVGAVATIEITSPAKVAINVPTEIKYVLKDANGVELKNDDGKVTYELDANSTDCWMDGNKINAFVLNKVSTVTAVYATGTYEAGTGTEIKIKSQPFAITCVESVEAAVDGAPVFTITDKTKGADVDFTKVNATIAKNDTKKYIQAKFKKVGNADTFYTDSTTDDKWTFESANNNILTVDDTGKLLPVAEGTVSIIAKYDKAIVGTFAITVGADAKSASIALDKTNAKLSNSDTLKESVTVKVTLKDQYGADFDNGDSVEKGLEVTADFAKDDKSGKKYPDAVVKPGTKEFSIDAAGVTPGTYRFKCTRDNRTVYFTLEVAKPNGAASRVIVAPTKSTVDMKIKEAKDVSDKSLDVSLIQVANNNVNDKAVTGAAVSYTVKNTTTGKVYVDKNTIKDEADNKKFFEIGEDGKMKINTVVLEGGQYYKLQAGTYVVSGYVDGSDIYDAKDGAGTDKTNKVKITQTQFVVNDTQETTSVKRKAVSYETYSTSWDSIVSELASCFELANDLGGKRTFVIADADCTTRTFESGKTYSVVVKSIVTSEDVDGATLKTAYNQNYTINVKIK